MISPASQSLVESIRGAILEAGKPVYLVAKEAQVSQPILSRFLNRKRGMTLQTADRLCRSLRLELRRTEPAVQRDDTATVAQPDPCDI